MKLYKRRILRSLGLAVVSLTVLFCGVVAYSIASIKPPVETTVQAASDGGPITPKPVPVTYSQNPRVVAVMQHLGLDYSHLNLYNGTPPILDAEAEYQNGSIYMTDWAFNDKPNRIASHEYIHYVQDGTSSHQAASFFPYLTQLRQTDSYLRQRMTDYTNGMSACKTDCKIPQETEAVACTEMADSRLSPSFTAFCNQWLPKREQTLILY